MKDYSQIDHKVLAHLEAHYTREGIRWKCGLSQGGVRRSVARLRSMGFVSNISPKRIVTHNLGRAV